MAKAHCTPEVRIGYYESEANMYYIFGTTRPYGNRELDNG